MLGNTVYKSKEKRKTERKKKREGWKKKKERGTREINEIFSCKCIL